MLFPLKSLGLSDDDMPIAICPHAPKAGCTCRKPEPGMLWWLMGHHGRLPDEVLFVGDMESDRQAADRAGCRFASAGEFFRWTTPGA